MAVHTAILKDRLIMGAVGGILGAWAVYPLCNRLSDSVRFK
jgi:hypothetical protein